MKTTPGIGHRVRVKPGVIDTDTRQSLAGWEATILAVEHDAYLLGWTVETLRNMTAAYRNDSLRGDLDHTRYYLPATDFEVLPDPRDLLDILTDARGSGTFCSRGEVSAIPLGLTIRDYGKVVLPLQPEQARELTEIGRQAPFGRGAETVLDTTVRNAYEIDAENVDIANPAWPAVLERIVSRVIADLDVGGRVVAEPYKLLLYEKGGFFLPHRDSEKAPGMFATLIIGLPSRHEGGRLRVSFDDQEAYSDFADYHEGFSFPYAAFFADCEHELTEVTAGYRLCLVYNLCRSGNGERPRALATSGIVEELSAAITALPFSDTATTPHTILLDHQYTPANFGFAALKGDDRLRADLLLAAATAAGYEAKLGLVTHYRMGEWENSGYAYPSYHRSYYDEYDDANEADAEMGEVYEQYTDLKLYNDTGQSIIGEFSVEETQILTSQTIGDGEPTEQEKEGFTGNAGMTLQYWYHYGAVAFWPRAATLDLLGDQSPTVAVNWLPLFLAVWEEEELDASQAVRNLLQQVLYHSTSLVAYGEPTVDFSALAKALWQLNDPRFYHQYGIDLLAQGAPWIDSPTWRRLLDRYGEKEHAALFSAACERVDPANLAPFLATLHELATDGSAALLKQLWPVLCTTVKRCRPTNFSDKDDLQRYYLPALAEFGRLARHASWTEAEKDLARQALTSAPYRAYVRHVLPAVITLLEPHFLAEAAREAALAWLRTAVADEPVAPADWSKPAPAIKHPLREDLALFMQNPQRTTLDFKAIQAERSLLESLLRGHGHDLKFETIRRGSPHTLRLTKTHARYERALREWEEDVALLKKLAGK